MNEELKNALTQMAKVCEDLAYYVDHPHFDGYDIRRDEYEGLMSTLPSLFQGWDR